MSSNTETLLDLATRPLAGNAEHHLAAQAELSETIARTNPSESSIHSTIEAFRASDTRKSSPKSGHFLWLYLLISLASLSAITQAIQIFKQSRNASAGYTIFNSIGPTSTQPFQQWKLTPREKLILLGDKQSTNPIQTWKPLWDLDPTNPAYFAEYLRAYQQAKRPIPPELLAKAEEMDPGNGWYHALAAGLIAEKAITKDTSAGRSTISAPKPTVWKINDPAKLSEALALIHQAATAPHFTGHELTLMAERIPMIPKAHDHLSQLPGIAYLASQPVASIQFRHVSDALNAGAQNCAANQDTKGFQQIIADWESITRKQIENGSSFIDLLVAKVFITGPALDFKNAADALGLQAEAERFDRIIEWRIKEDKGRKQNNRLRRDDDIISLKGSLLATLAIPTPLSNSNTQVTITESQLAPTRYAEHSYYHRLAAISTWLLFGLLAGAATLLLVKQNPLVLALSQRMTDLLRPSDWSWILIGGTLFPLAFYLVILHLTPFSSREWSMKPTGLQQPVLQYASLLILTITLSITLANWRLSLRGNALGLSRKRQWIPWAASFSATLAMLHFGSLMLLLPRFGMLTLFAGYALLGIPALWLLTGLLLQFIGHRSHNLRRATLTRAFIPACLLTATAFVATLPLHHALERKWITRDTLFTLNPQAPSLSSPEWSATQQLRKDLSQTLTNLSSPTP
jgi:hypothetical protein